MEPPSPLTHHIVSLAKAITLQGALAGTTELVATARTVLEQKYPRWGQKLPSLSAAECFTFLLYSAAEANLLFQFLAPRHASRTFSSHMSTAYRILHLLHV